MSESDLLRDVRIEQFRERYREGSTLRSAVLSDDRRYRLDRRWDIGKAPMVWVMLNPSTADETIDDLTIKKCMGFAAGDRCGGIVVVNLFAFRATMPTDLWRARARGVDIVGPDNDTHIQAALGSAAVVVAAWGNQGDLERGRSIASLVKSFRVPLKCLGLTRAGQPRHPSRLAYDTPMKEWYP